MVTTRKNPSKLPVPKNTKASVTSRGLKAKRKAKQRVESKQPGSQGRGVVMIKNIPRGFYEKQIREYFQQFGDVTRIRLSRSKKSGKAKGHGWIEFAYADVAKTAADTMNNYLMFDTLVKCEYKDSNELHKDLFKGCTSHLSANGTTRSRTISRQNKEKTPAQDTKLVGKMRTKLRKKVDKLKSLGIDYTLPVEFPKRDGAGGKKKEKADATLKPEIPVTSHDTDGSTTGGDTDTDEDQPATAFLLLDSEDDEITFRTPPNTVKVSKSKFLSNPSLMEITHNKSMQNKRPSDVNSPNTKSKVKKRSR